MLLYFLAGREFYQKSYLIICPKSYLIICARPPPKKRKKHCPEILQVPNQNAVLYNTSEKGKNRLQCFARTCSAMHQQNDAVADKDK